MWQFTHTTILISAGQSDRKGIDTVAAGGCRREDQRAVSGNVDADNYSSEYDGELLPEWVVRAFCIYQEEFRATDAIQN